MSTITFKINNNSYCIVSNDNFLTNKLRKNIKFKTGYVKEFLEKKNKIEHSSYVIYIVTEEEMNKLEINKCL